jgi:hypothetical protein
MLQPMPKSFKRLWKDSEAYWEPRSLWCSKPGSGHRARRALFKVWTDLMAQDQDTEPYNSAGWHLHVRKHLGLEFRAGRVNQGATVDWSENHPQSFAALRVPPRDRS